MSANSQLLEKAWHSLEVDKTLSLLESDAVAGLTSQQAQQRLSQYGSNELEASAGRTPWIILLDQFKNIMLLMLIAVAVASAILDLRANQFPKDAIAITSIVILNGILGYLQESRAEKALFALKRLAAPMVRVVRDGYIPIGEFKAESTLNPGQYPELQALLIACVLCNDAVLRYEQHSWTILGDPTEGALLVLAGKGGVDNEPLRRQMPRVAEFPFSSERKRMSVICPSQHSVVSTQELELPLSAHPFLMFTKGSPELILSRCTSIQVGNGTEPLTQQQRTRILKQNNERAAQGLRVLGIACKPLDTIPPAGSDETTEQKLVWLGLVGMLDAPRTEVREAVSHCRQAGIRPIMITGDRQLTASAIADKLGIAQLGDRVLTGQDLQQISHAVAVRSNTRLALELNPFSNPYLLAAVTVTIALQLMLIYVPPLRNFFGTHWLSPIELAICFGFSALMFVWIELEKLFIRWYKFQ